MAKFSATIEQSSDGSWSAEAVIGDYTILGDGNTRDEAIDSLRKGIQGEIDHLKSKGESLPVINSESISIEVVEAA